ncbi:hypothetical protein K32_48610 [Kaistia sp. 32K]|uniref:hypothetical protein n=1 Tax=Kaistia sp. 32K TaxID=2795690 RepID=UPI001915868E|nr:hypothetical protein [Kaistia sp. 32K]BCP56244.1 hypothetical protein K32_48610 [Kaistia sp. 32K]
MSTPNVGTIGHVSHGKTSTARSILFALAAAGVLSCAQATPVMPTRRPWLEPNFDLNQLLGDAGRRGERQARKADRRARMQDLQRAAAGGAQ